MLPSANFTIGRIGKCEAARGDQGAMNLVDTDEGKGTSSTKTDTVGSDSCAKVGRLSWAAAFAFHRMQGVVAASLAKAGTNSRNFYDRTLQEHAEKCKRHMELVQKQERAQLALVSSQLQNDCEVAESSSPSKSKSNKGSPSNQIVDSCVSIKTSPSKSMCSSSPQTPSSSSSKTAGRSKLLQQLKSMLVGMHMTVSNMRSAKVYSMLLDFARVTGVLVPTATDSGTVFTECVTMLAMKPFVR